MTLAETLIPRAMRRSIAGRVTVEILLVLGGSLLVALAARLRIDLPFTPVPITAQPFAVLLVGAALGSLRGALSMAAYIIEGAAGLPVFSGGGCCVIVLAGPAGGFIMSYPIAAGLTGWLAELGWDMKFATTALAMLAGNIVIYLVGLSWLAVFVGDQVFAAGLFPFIVGDAIKLILAAITLPVAWKVIGGVRKIEK